MVTIEQKCLCLEQCISTHQIGVDAYCPIRFITPNGAWLVITKTEMQQLLIDAIEADCLQLDPTNRARLLVSSASVEIISKTTDGQTVYIYSHA